MATRDDHGSRAQLGVVGVGGVEHDHPILALALVGDRLGGRLEVHGHVELLDRLLAQVGDEVASEDPRMAGNVEDPLLRIQGRQLAADVGQ